MLTAHNTSSMESSQQQYNSNTPITFSLCVYTMASVQHVSVNQTSVTGVFWHGFGLQVYFAQSQRLVGLLFKLQYNMTWKVMLEESC